MASKRFSGGFLTGRSVSFDRLVTEKEAGADEWRVESDDALPPSPKMDAFWPKEAEFGPLTLYRRRAMATDFEISVNDLQVGTRVTDVAEADHPCQNDRRQENQRQDDRRENLPFDALDVVDQIEENLSVFRPTSLVSRINALAAEMDVPVTPSLFEWLTLSRRLWEETDGAFDITASILWKVWGFARHEGHVPADSEIADALDKVGMEKIRLNEDGQTVAFSTPGTEINFGAIGKGIALDEAATLFMANDFPDFLIQGGMSSALAHGGRAGDLFVTPSETGMEESRRKCWTIGVAHPLKPTQRLAELRLVDSALGTSGSGRQFFFYKGRRLSHIIDPATGQPATGVLSATVLAPTAAEADALSTAFFVMGPEKTEQYCRRHPDCRVLLILDARGGTDFDLTTFNLTPDLFRLTD